MEQFQLNWCCHHHFKNGLCATLLFAHVREVQAPPRSKHIWTRSRELAPTLSARGVCWHFTHVLLDTETQLLQATGLVAVSSGLLTLRRPELNPLGYCFWKACKHSIYRNKRYSICFYSVSIVWFPLAPSSLSQLRSVLIMVLWHKSDMCYKTFPYRLQISVWRDSEQFCPVLFIDSRKTSKHL